MVFLRLESVIGRKGSKLLLKHRNTGQVFEVVDDIPKAIDLSTSASVVGKSGFSKAGTSLSKHGTGKRTSSCPFPAPMGTPAQINAQAEKVLEDILTHPDKVIKQRLGRPGEQLLQIHRPDGSGVIYKWDGKEWVFSHFGVNLY